jgi:hypothetical protein
LPWLPEASWLGASIVESAVVRVLVASAPMRDLLFRAKHLFFSATMYATKVVCRDDEPTRQAE